MRILVIGGTGNILKPLVQKLSLDSYNEIVVVARSSVPCLRFNNISYACGNMFEQEFADAILSDYYDAIIDGLWHSPQSIKLLLPRLLQATKHYIFLGSCAVYADNESIITEDSPTWISKPDFQNELNEYHISKGLAEQVVIESGNKNWTIIRPHITVGERNFPIGTWLVDFWLNRVAHNLPLAVPEEILNRKTNFTSSGFVANQIAAIIGNPQAFGQVFNVVSNAVYRWSEIITACRKTILGLGGNFMAKRCSCREIIDRFPETKYRFLKDRCLDRVFSNSKIIKLTGLSGDDFENLEGLCHRYLNLRYAALKKIEIGCEWIFPFALHDKCILYHTTREVFSFRCWFMYSLARIGIPRRVLRIPSYVVALSKHTATFALKKIWFLVVRMGLEDDFKHCWLLPRILSVRWNYCKVLRRLRRLPVSSPVRVVFVVSDPVKFKCKRLYELMRDSKLFKPIVAISAWNNRRDLTDEQLEEDVKNTEGFFDSLDIDYIRIFTTNPRKEFDLSELKPDIVIYTEPWRPSPQQTSEIVSRYALTCYIPYYVPNYGVFQAECLMPLHKFLYCYFTCSYWAEYFTQRTRWWNHAAKFVPSGHPALDYFSSSHIQEEREYIIYAPHWTIPYPIENVSWFLSTFEWTGKAILDYAKAHPEQKWVFKPHPVLKAEILRTGVMSRKEMEEYYKEWERIAIADYGSEYQNLFLKAKVFVTDSGSFLTEAGAIGCPVIRLVCRSKKTLVPLPPSKKIYDTYYNVHNLDEMYAAFKMVIEQDKDPRRVERLAAVESAGIRDSNASQYIYNYLKKFVAQGKKV